MTARLLVLVPNAGTALRWRRLDDDGVQVGSGVLIGDAFVEVDPDTRVTAVVPGNPVSLHWVEMPSASTAQAAAAARIMAGEFIAAPVADQHVAAAPVADTDGMRAIAIVARTQMRAWLAALARHGIDPDDVVPAPLLLPVPADGVTTLQSGDMLLVRGHRLALEAEPALAEMMVQGRRAEAAPRDLLDLAASLPAAELPINLRQGEFRRAGDAAFDRRSIRRVALLAAACVVAFFGAQAATALRYHFAANALEAAIDADARRVLPGGTAIADPLQQINQQLRASGGSGGFSGMASSVFAALEASGNLRLESLRYSTEGGMRATLLAPTGASLEPLRTRLAASGLNFVEGATRGSETGQVIDIEVSRL